MRSIGDRLKPSLILREEKPKPTWCTYVEIPTFHTNEDGTTTRTGYREQVLGYDFKPQSAAFRLHKMRDEWHAPTQGFHVHQFEFER